MLHLLYCRRARPLWKAALAFTINTLRAPAPLNPVLAIAFGQWHQHDADNPLGPEVARAFLRHVFQHFYHDFSNVDLKDTKFCWEHTYYSELVTFREAARRRGYSFTRLRANRRYTSLPSQPPEEELNKYPTVLLCTPGTTPTINPAIDAEIERARANALRAARNGR